MSLLDYRCAAGVATVSLDDGKANVLSPPMIGAIHGALDRATADGAVVVLRGRPGLFSAGFDLGVLRGGGFEALTMVRAGFELAERLLGFPRPVVAAVSGHAVAMGLFLAQAADYRVGASGPYRLVANEVAIGLTLPHAATEILRGRLTPAAFHRAAVLAEPFGPDAAVAAGLLDEVVQPDLLDGVAHERATALTALDATAHAATKLRARGALLDAVRDAVVTELTP